ncbi:BTB/POZ domain-containing protein [Hibiscus syriacus]|uniref:BTB/POZ domain-containing protein n=1 Tax=Hibiscus syriacus TaxID=106335 RepID=A0A6A2WMK4_HIBSY|nr:BTB/POZ domain-containing protein [Hibiscus syriacus]
MSGNGKLFIGGISWDTDEERLKEYFSSFGEVVEAVIMKDRTQDVLVAKKEVPRDDQNIMSRSTSSIHCSPGPGRTRKIFVGGLASTVTESDFKKYFDQFGNITDVVVMYDHNTKRPRGFGFITYDSEEAVDKVLLKNFHELNGKMVEGYTPSSVGGYGLRMDGRFSPVAGGQSGLPPFGSGYGMGMNFEPGLNPSFANSANFSANMNYGRGLCPYYIGNANRFGNPSGFDGATGGNTSFFSSVTRNLWGNGGLNYNTNAASSGALWDLEVVVWEEVPSEIAELIGGMGETMGPMWCPAPNGGYDGAFADLYGGASVYGDTTWRSSTSERDGSGSFGYVLGSATSDS